MGYILPLRSLYKDGFGMKQPVKVDMSSKSTKLNQT